jgi:hypothetical protein
MTIVPKPGTHVLLVVLRSSIERTFWKLMEPILFPLAENSRKPGQAAAHKQQQRTITLPVHSIPSNSSANYPEFDMRR